MHVSDKLLQLTRRCFCFKVFDFGLSVSPDVHVQLLLLTFGVNHPSAWGQQERTQPQRVNLKYQRVSNYPASNSQCSSAVESYVDVLVEARDCSLQMLHGYQHVLDHVVLFVEPSDSLPLGELQQRNLRRNHPSKNPAEHWVVAEGNDILEKNTNTDRVRGTK